MHTTSDILMVYPSSFGFDEQTAETNAFQHHAAGSPATIRGFAVAEFGGAAAALRQHGIDVHVFIDPDQSPKPNAIFPNNWLTTWGTGTVCLYPMATKSRRVERTPAVLDFLRQKFIVSSVIDLSPAEQDNRILEGTGAMVFDHGNRIAYACESPRTDGILFKEHCTDLGYQPVLFQASDRYGVPIYHTNVMMGVQQSSAVVCTESISDDAERSRVTGLLAETGHSVVDISHQQMESFAGNVLELQGHARGKPQPILLMSGSAHKALTPHQRDVLNHEKLIVPVDIPTIEMIGGGSARCMVAEIFLPKRISAV